jgi:hypothetical protein
MVMRRIPNKLFASPVTQKCRIGMTEKMRAVTNQTIRSVNWSCPLFYTERSCPVMTKITFLAWQIAEF